MNYYDGYPYGYDPLLVSACWGGTDLHWSETVVVPPPCEPISLAQVKDRLRIVHSADDNDLRLLLRAARLKVEGDTSAVLVSATIDQTVDRPPVGATTLRLVRWPVQSIVSVTTHGPDGTDTVLDPAAYTLDTASRPARLILTSALPWPTTLRATNAVTVRFVAGFAGPSVPVTQLTWAAGMATCKTQGSNTLLASDLVTLRGAIDDVYNNTFTVTSSQGSTITFGLTPPAGWPDPESPASGSILALELGTPEPLLLAVLALVTHYYDPLRAGLMTDRPDVLPFGYDDLIRDRLEWLV